MRVNTCLPWVLWITPIKQLYAWSPTRTQTHTCLRWDIFASQNLNDKLHTALKSMPNGIQSLNNAPTRGAQAWNRRPPWIQSNTFGVNQCHKCSYGERKWSYRMGHNGNTETIRFQPFWVVLVELPDLTQNRSIGQKTRSLTKTTICFCSLLGCVYYIYNIHICICTYSIYHY